MPEFQSKQPESVLLKAVESTFTQIIRDNFIDIFLVAPTLPVTVFLRKKLGFRVVKPWVIYLAFLYFNAWAFVPVLVTAVVATRQPNYGSPYGGQPEPTSDGREGLIFWLLELLFLVLAIYWRVHAWKLIKQGELWHTRSRGISFLSIIPISRRLMILNGRKGSNRALGSAGTKIPTGCRCGSSRPCWAAMTWFSASFPSTSNESTERPNFEIGFFCVSDGCGVAAETTRGAGCHLFEEQPRRPLAHFIDPGLALTRSSIPKTPGSKSANRTRQSRR